MISYLLKLNEVLYERLKQFWVNQWLCDIDYIANSQDQMIIFLPLVHLGKFKCARNPLDNENAERSPSFSRERELIYLIFLLSWFGRSPLKISRKFSSNLIYFKRESREGLTTSCTFFILMIKNDLTVPLSSIVVEDQFHQKVKQFAACSRYRC